MSLTIVNLHFKFMDKILEEYKKLYRQMWGKDTYTLDEDMKRLGEKELKKEIREMKKIISDNTKYIYD